MLKVDCSDGGDGRWCGDDGAPVAKRSVGQGVLLLRL